MIVELISVGTEILLGNIVNTNAAFLAEKCALLGVSLYHQVAVGDNEERLEAAIRMALERSDIVILTGGLGPTKDDLTKEVTARVFGRGLYLHQRSKERIETFFAKRGVQEITENNWRQAIVPDGAKVVDNDNGLAPGVILTEGEKTAILLPGPPNELKPMFVNDIAPYLNSLQPEGIYSKMVKISSIGESQVDSMVADILESQSNPTLAPYAKTGEVHLRITAKAESEEEAVILMEPMLSEVKKRFGDYIFTTEEEETLEDVIVKMLKADGRKLSLAESCTGGLLAGRLVNAAGASEVFEESYVTYSNHAKEKLLGVKSETLETYGAVSEQTAGEMARGAANAAGTDVGVGVTGIAGPGGGTEEKPVGLVYIGCYVDGQTRVERCQFGGNREKIRDYSVVRALTILREELLKKRR